MFRNVVDSDNGVWKLFGILADAMILNIMFVICCIPVVTIGAAVTALYTVTLRMAEKKHTYVMKDFFKAFKSNFKQSTIIWLIMLVIGVFIGVDLVIAGQITSTMGTVMKCVFLFLAILYVMTLSYVFPLQSKFENTIFRTMSNSLFMSVGFFIPWTFLIVMVNVLPIIWILFNIMSSYVLPLMMVCGFSFMAMANSNMLMRVFKRFIPEEEEESAEIAEVE